MGLDETMNNEVTRQFVRETLGCTCPDEVFQHIDCRTGVKAGENILLDYEINVGNNRPCRTMHHDRYHCNHDAA